MEFIRKNTFVIFSVILGLNILIFFVFLATKYYSPILMALNIASVLVLWTSSVWPIKKPSLLLYKKDLLIIVCLLLAAFLIRIKDLTTLPPGMYGDEIAIGVWGLKLLKSAEILPFLHNYSHPTPLIYLAGISVEIFGKTMIALRLPSVIFGSLSVVLFYVLLRLFFKKPIALIGGVLLCAYYPHLVISRLAYEPAASFFFQILSAIFLYKTHKTQNPKYILGLGLALAGGMYTYLNFRLFSVFALLIAVVLLFKNKKHFKQNLYYLFSSFFIGIMPMLSFAMLFPVDFWGRTNEIFIFNEHLPPDEIVKELWGSTLRSFGIFGVYGDPSPKHNPAGVPFFDLLTVFFIAAGTVGLFIKKRILLIIVTLLSLPSFINDIFSLERIPEFHYYGIGHPHGMRISAMAGIGLFLAVWGFYHLKNWGEKKNKFITHPLIIIGVIFISSLHLYWYFNQASVNLMWYYYNYNVNGQSFIKASEEINKSKSSIVYISPSYRNTAQVDFFTDNSKKLILFTPKTSDDVYKIIKSGNFALLSLTPENIPLINDAYKKLQQENLTVNIKTITAPYGKDEAVIFTAN